jgi:hypothetical protein
VALGPLKLGWTYEIRDMDPTGGFAYKTITSGPLGMDGEVRLTPTGPNATRVDYSVDVRTRGLLRILEPLLRGEVTRNEAGEVERLKARLEGAAG